MEEYVLWTGRVLEHREDRGHGPSDVCCVQCQCNVYCFLGAYVHFSVIFLIVVVVVVDVGHGGAVWGVVELRGFFELMGDGGVVCGIVGGGGGAWTRQQEEG